MAGTILENATVLIQIGTAWSAGVPTYPAASSFMAQCRRLVANDELGRTNVKGAGAGRAKNRYTHGQGKITLLGVMPASTGYNFKAMAAANPLGLMIKVTSKPHSALATPDVWEGVITTWEADQTMENPSIETIEIDPDFDSWT